MAESPQDKDRIVAKKFLVGGCVQGVGFRWSTRQQARSMQLTGWVRNRADGQVEGQVSGRAEAVEEFLRWLGEGPVGARVDNLIVDQFSRDCEGFAAQHDDGFEIR